MRYKTRLLPYSTDAWITIRHSLYLLYAWTQLSVLRTMIVHVPKVSHNTFRIHHHHTYTTCHHTVPIVSPHIVAPSCVLLRRCCCSGCTWRACFHTLCSHSTQGIPIEEMIKLSSVGVCLSVCLCVRNSYLSKFCHQPMASSIVRGWLYAIRMKSYNPFLWMVARIFSYKIVHVGDFILSHLSLYLCFFRTFIYGILSYLGPRGEPPFFQTWVIFAVQSNAFIRIHINRWFCSMGHSWILVRIHTN